MQSQLTSEKYLELLTRETSEAIVVALIDIEAETSTVIEANTVASEMLGRSLEGIIGGDLEQLLPEEYRGGHFSKMIARRAMGAGQMRSAKDIDKNKVFAWNEAEGRQFPVTADIGYSELDGKLLAIARIQDDSERSALRDELIADKKRIKAERDRMELVLQVGDIGLWTWDTSRGQLDISDSWFTMTGQPKSEISTMLSNLATSGLSQKRQLEHLIDWWSKRVHVDDVDAARKEIERYLLMRSDGEDGYHNQYRYRTLDKNGEDNGFIVISSQGRAFWDEQGQLINLFIAQTEVTQLAERERANRDELEKVSLQLKALQTTQAESAKANKESAIAMADVTKQVQKFAGLMKVAVPAAVAAMGFFSEVGQEALSGVSRGVGNIGAAVETEVNEASEAALPVLFSKDEQITAVLEAARRDSGADLVLIGHYSNFLSRGKATLETATGQVAFQARKVSYPIAAEDPWPISGVQPFEARAIRHSEGNCYEINSAPPADGRLSAIAYQVSCPIAIPSGGDEQLGFVAIEFAGGDVDKSAVEAQVKALAVEVEEILNKANSNQGVIVNARIIS